MSITNDINNRASEKSRISPTVMFYFAHILFAKSRLPASVTVIIIFRFIVVEKFIVIPVIKIFGT